jgi:hypothetical protein
MKSNLILVLFIVFSLNKGFSQTTFQTIYSNNTEHPFNGRFFDGKFDNINQTIFCTGGKLFPTNDEFNTGLKFTLTDEDGNVVINKSFVFKDNLQNEYVAAGLKIVKMAGQDIYAITGYIRPKDDLSKSQILFMKVDNAGNVIVAKGFYFTKDQVCQGYSIDVCKNFCASTVFIITGQAGTELAFISLDASGSVVSASSIDISISANSDRRTKGFDIVFDPANSNYAYFVGEHYENGVLYGLIGDYITGSAGAFPINQFELISNGGNIGNSVSFNSIKYSPEFESEYPPTNTRLPFVISGYYDQGNKGQSLLPLLMVKELKTNVPFFTRWIKYYIGIPFDASFDEGGERFFDAKSITNEDEVKFILAASSRVDSYIKNLFNSYYYRSLSKGYWRFDLLGNVQNSTIYRIFSPDLVFSEARSIDYNKLTNSTFLIGTYTDSIDVTPTKIKVPAITKINFDGSFNYKNENEGHSPCDYFNFMPNSEDFDEFISSGTYTRYGLIREDGYNEIDKNEESISLCGASTLVNIINKNVEKSSFKLVPNYFTENEVNFELVVGNNNKHSNLKIFDVNGKMVFQDLVCENNIVKTKLEKGIYFVFIIIESAEYHEKIIVQ